MSNPHDLDRLYNLMPAIYRMRDAEQGYTLRALLRLIGREAQVIEDDLLQLYEGAFIETCPDWLVPYIGELIGYVPATSAGDPGNQDVSDPRGQARARARVLIPRRDVANTIHDRRRKGTLALLEGIARDAAGWPARAVEFFRWLAWAQNLNYLRPRRGGTADMRHGLALAGLGGPFNTTALTPNVRSPNSTLAPGFPNVPAVGLFVWRLRSYAVTHCRADNLEEIGPHCFTFSALGNDAPIFNQPPDGQHDAPAGPLDLPMPITRRMFEERLPADPRRQPPVLSIASGDYYGLEKSVAIWAPDWPVRGAPQPVPRQSIIPADLTAWKYRPPRNYIAVDPERGRFMFPPNQPPRGSVYVHYAYGFASAIGGGEYERELLETAGAIVYHVARDRPGIAGALGDALRRWRETQPRPKSAIIEIVDSSVYTEPLNVELDEDETLQIRAASGARPVIRLLDYTVDRPDPFSVRGKHGSSLTLDGLLFTGRGLAVQGPEQEEQDDGGDLCRLIIRHCTLVPGWGLHDDCDPTRPAEPSLEVFGSRAEVLIQHSILGSILIEVDQAAREPVRVELSDSILDATELDCDGPQCQAITAPGGLVAHAALTLRRCTVFGRVHAHSIELAENSIFTGQVRVARRRSGCMRFCYVPIGSRTPPRYECQPDKVTAGLGTADSASAAVRVQPQFMSTRYGTPDYARLAGSCAVEIREGADDQSEMGVYHDLYEPQRAALLRMRLQEYTPAGLEAGLNFTT